jgi:hypothetical protein
MADTVKEMVRSWAAQQIVPLKQATVYHNRSSYLACVIAKHAIRRTLRPSSAVVTCLSMLTEGKAQAAFLRLSNRYKAIVWGCSVGLRTSIQ